MRKGDDRADNFLMVFVRHEVPDERLIDFEPAQRKTLQIAQR